MFQRVDVGLRFAIKQHEPCIEVIEQRIAGCERCRGDEAELPFDWILAGVLSKHGPYEFVMSEPARCPNCRAELTEKSLVEGQGGVEVESFP